MVRVTVSPGRTNAATPFPVKSRKKFSVMKLAFPSVIVRNEP